MNPMTRLTLDLSVTDAEVILTMMLKAPVPGEYWFNTFSSVKKQIDAFVAAQNEPHTPMSVQAAAAEPVPVHPLEG